MLRFTQMNFNVRPEKDGNYICFRKHEKEFTTISFTTEFGWNTTRFSPDEVDNMCVISDSDMARHFGYWLKPYTIGPENWSDQLEEMMEEIKGELYQYADRKLNDDEMWACSNLEDMYDLLERAKEYAEVLR